MPERIVILTFGDMEGGGITNLGAGAEPADAVNQGQVGAKFNATGEGARERYRIRHGR